VVVETCSEAFGVADVALEAGHEVRVDDAGALPGSGGAPDKNGPGLLDRASAVQGPPDIYYNDLAQWHYHLLPQALGCDGWFTARVTTCAELDAALATARSCGTGAYIEVVTDKYVASPVAMKMHASTKTLYKG
jgi:hypothetical protein